MVELKERIDSLTMSFQTGMISRVELNESLEELFKSEAPKIVFNTVGRNFGGAKYDRT